MARVILISALKKNDLVEHPKGGACFGVIPAIPQHGIKRGGIYLRKGDHAARFGVDHIWQAHEYDLRKLGYLIAEDVAAYVAKIIEPGTPIFYDQKDGRRVAVLRTRFGKLFLEPRNERSGFGYYVVTAFPHQQARGTRVGVVLDRSEPTSLPDEMAHAIKKVP